MFLLGLTGILPSDIMKFKVQSSGGFVKVMEGRGSLKGKAAAAGGPESIGFYLNGNYFWINFVMFIRSGIRDTCVCMYIFMTQSQTDSLGKRCILIRQCTGQLWWNTRGQERCRGGTIPTELRRVPPVMAGLMFGPRTCSWARCRLLGAVGRRLPAFPALSSSNMVSVAAAS